LGQWNQLFRLMPDCTMSAVLPVAIGRVRGFENQNLTLCLELKTFGDHTQLVTGKCAYTPGTAVALETMNASTTTVSSGGDNSKDGSNGNNTNAADTGVVQAEIASRYAKELLRKKQVFEFIRRDGSIHKSLMPGFVPTSVPLSTQVVSSTSSAKQAEVVVNAKGNVN
jgi:hypothetical protein